MRASREEGMASPGWLIEESDSSERELDREGRTAMKNGYVQGSYFEARKGLRSKAFFIASSKAILAEYGDDLLISSPVAVIA